MKKPNVVERLLPYYRLLLEVKWHFIGALLFSIIYGVSSGLGMPLMAHKVFPKVFGPEPPSQMVLLLVVIYLPAVFLIRNISGFMSTYLASYSGLKVLENIRFRVFSKLQRLPLLFFQRRKHGDLLSRTMSDTQNLQQMVVGVSNDLFKQPISFISAIGALIYLAFKNEQIIFVFFSLMIIPISILPMRYFGRKVFKKAKAMQQEGGVITECLKENLGAVREVRAFSLQEYEGSKFLTILRGIFKLQLKVVKYTKSLSPAIEFTASIGVAIAIYYAATARIQIEEAAPLLLALYASYEPLKKMGVIHNDIKRGLASLERVEEVLEEPEVIKDAPDGITLKKVKGEIQFHDVSFSYGEGPVLKNISCTLEAGKIYALVGHSGAGKSTFINLTMRFYEPNSGKITLDNHDLKKIKIRNLRDQIALVPQDPILFNDTIANNIGLSRLGSTREEIAAAAEKAHARAFIESFPNGYDTLVGDRGTRLSGGQKQRVAIARAYLKDAQILILDEATSSLDTESESIVQDALKELVKGKTAIMIAHRFSTIKMADQILVFDQGNLVSLGDHESLIKEKSVYYDLYKKQRLG